MKFSSTQLTIAAAVLVVFGAVAGLWLGGRLDANRENDAIRFDGGGGVEDASAAVDARADGSGVPGSRRTVTSRTRKGSADSPSRVRGGDAANPLANGGAEGAATGQGGKSARERNAGALIGHQKVGAGKSVRSALPGVNKGSTTGDDAAAEEAAKKDAQIPSGYVRGIVTTVAKVPLAGVTVRNVGAAVSAGDAQGVVTGADGQFLLGGVPLPPATIRLVAESAYAVSTTVACQAGMDAASAPFVTLILSAAGGLTVAVVDAAGKPVAEARVFIKDETEQRLLAQGTTDEQGRFVSTSIPVGTGVVLAEKTGYAPPGYGSGTQSRKTATIVADQNSTLELILSRTAVVTGSVVDAAGQPVAGAGVFLRMFSLSGLRSSAYNSASVYSDAQGQFTLNELPDGRVELCAVLELRGVSPWAPVPAADGDGQRWVTLPFLPSGTLIGRVLNDKSRALPDAVVTWHPASSAYDALPAWRLLRAPNDGTFTAIGIPAVDGVLTATVDGTYTGTAAVSAADVDSGKPVTIVVKAPGEQKLTGSVVGVSGAGLGGAAVRLHGAGGSSVQSVATRADGTFALTLTGDGPWSVSAAAAGYAPRLFSFTPEQAGGDQFLVLDAGSTVAFDIVTDVPVANLATGTAATLNLTLLSLPGTPFVVSQRAVLQATTVLVVEHLFPGTYRCEVTAPSMSARSFNLTVQDLPGVAQILSTSITLTFGATVRGRVLAADGTPIPEAIVRLDGHSLPRTVSGNNGTFALTAVPAGVVAIRAETADRFALSGAFQVAAGDELALPDLRLDQARTDVTASVLVKVGLGVTWQPATGGGWGVAQVVAGTGAAALGIQTGDRLVSVNGANVSASSWETLQNALNGEAGTTVDLVLDRGGVTVPVRAERQIMP